MLARTQSKRLCSRCRFDLLSLFESGIADSNRGARHSFVARTQIPTQSRKYNSSPQRLVQPSRNPSQPRSAEPPVSEHATFNASQLDALNDLQRVLGRPLTNHIDEAELKELIAEAEERLQDKDGEAQANDEVQLEAESSSVEPPDQSLIALRKKGASPHEVVREARQVFGDYLPDGVLEQEEMKIYRRMYGTPTYRDREDAIDAHDDLPSDSRNRPSPETQLLDNQGNKVSTLNQSQHEVEEANAVADEERRDLQILAEAVGGELVDEDFFLDDEDTSAARERAHPMTILGKAGTRPSTVSLPKEAYLEPLARLLSDASNKQLKEVSERVFGGGGLPDSPLNPRSGRSRKQIPIPLTASNSFMGEMEANVFASVIMPTAYAGALSILSEIRKRLGQTWLTNLLAREGGPRVLDTGGGGAGIMAWNEVVRAHWEALHTCDSQPPRPPRSKSVVLTGSDPLRHRSAALLNNTTFIPRLPDYVHTRNKPTLDDDRSQQSRKQFDIIFSAYSLLPFKEEWERKQYVQNLWSLLSPTGGVLIFMEKGIPRGFEAIAAARELLLERYIATPAGHKTHYTMSHDDQEDPVHQQSLGMIVAPCTNHERCPMYRVPGEMHGRKDYCSFQQRFIRPRQLQQILGAKDRNHDDLDFSYIAVTKGHDLREHQFSNWNHLADPLTSPSSPSGAQAQSQSNSPTWLDACKSGFASVTPGSMTDIAATPSATLPPTHLMPRVVFEPIKRQGHIILDVCTPTGSLERWTVAKSFSKQAFRDARKAGWGDLWALGAKSRIARNLRLGTVPKETKAPYSRSDRRRAQASEKLDQMRDLDDGDVETVIDHGAPTEDDDDDAMDEVLQDLGISPDEPSEARPSSKTPQRKAAPTGSSKPPVNHISPTSTNRHQLEIESDADRQLEEEWEEDLRTDRKERTLRRSKQVTKKDKRLYRAGKRTAI